MDGPVTPLVFTTAADDTVRQELARTRAPIIDFFDIHMSRVEEILGLRGLHEAARLHGVGDIRSYNTRMAAVEFTIEHDDGQSIRGLEKADVILHRAVAVRQDADQHVPRAPARPVRRQLPAGRRGPRAAPTSPRCSRDHLAACVGLTTTVERLSRVRNERRPGSRYASAEQCRWELRRASELYAANRIPVIDSSSRSVEEMATLIVQTRNQNLKRAAT